MILFILLSSVSYQLISMPKNDSFMEFVVYLTIPNQQLKFVGYDSLFFADYEIQLKVYDKKGNQLHGDYWQRRILKDTVDIYDSVKIIAPNRSGRYNLKIIDLNGQEILSVTEKIMPIKFLGNIRWSVSSETLKVKFTIVNRRSEADKIIGRFGHLSKELVPATGLYDDSLYFPVEMFAIGEYPLKFEVFGRSKKIDAVTKRVKVTRPFYLDEKTWALRVAQLEYIATPWEMSRLKSAARETRDSLWQDFWKQHDPTPNTPKNEKEIEYFERIDYSEANFSWGDKGWRSDRGRIYVKYGPPDEIQSRPYELSTRPYEVWLYYQLNLKFIFLDRYGFGEYILVNPEGDRI